MSIKHAAMGLALLAPVSLDSAVGKYVADADAVLYLKGKSLYLIRNTREPKAELLDQGVTDFGFRDGLIAYVRSSYLHVRRLAEDSGSPARRLSDSQGVSSVDIDGGAIVFLKNGSELYRVTDFDQGKADRVVYPVTEIQVSKSK